MADIATLGIKIDSSQAGTASKELDKLKASAGGAEKAATSLGKAAGPGLNAVESAAKRAGVSVEEFRARMAKASESVNKNFPLMSKGAKEAAASAYALTDALGGGKGGSSGVAPAMERAERGGTNLVNTLTRRFVLGYVISQVKSLGAAIGGLNAEVARTGDLGKLTGLGSQGVQGLQSTAGSKGITSEAFAAGIIAFNQQIPTAKAGIGSLGELLRGNHVTVKNTEDAFFKVADLVKNARTETEKESILRQAMLPATLDWVRYMGQGADAIRAAAAGTSKLTDAQIEGAQKVRDTWNDTWQKFRDGGTLAIADLVTKFEGLEKAGAKAVGNSSFANSSFWNMFSGSDADRAKRQMQFGAQQGGGSQLTQSGADAFYNATGANRSTPSGAPTRDVATEKAIAQDRISKAQQYLGLLGATTTALEARRAVELQIQSAGLNGVGIDSARAETLKRLAEEQNLGITAMRQSADAARVEAETIGMSVGKAQEYVAVQNALNEARRNGKVLTEGNVESIRNEARALGEAAQHADTMRWTYTNLVQGPMQTFRSSIASGATAWDAFKAAGSSALNAISTKLMDMAANGLWQAAFPGGGGGFGGLLSGLFGGTDGGASTFNLGGSAGAIFAKGGIPSASSDISRYSNQVVSKPTFFAKGGNVMGEAGPEAVMPLVRTPDGNLGVRSQGGASQSPVSVTIVQHNDFRGADPGSEARINAKLQKVKQEAVSEATQAVSRLNMNAPGSYLPGRR